MRVGVTPHAHAPPPLPRSRFGKVGGVSVFGIRIGVPCRAVSQSVGRDICGTYHMALSHVIR